MLLFIPGQKRVARLMKLLTLNALHAVVVLLVALPRRAGNLLLNLRPAHINPAFCANHTRCVVHSLCEVSRLRVRYLFSPQHPLPAARSHHAQRLQHFEGRIIYLTRYKDGSLGAANDSVNARKSPSPRPPDQVPPRPRPERLRTSFFSKAPGRPASFHSAQRALSVHHFELFYICAK